MKLPLTLMAGLLLGCATGPSPTPSLEGWTRSAVEQRYGEPQREWRGHYGIPPVDFARQYPKVVSCFHDLPIRDLYVTYQLRETNWFVIAHSLVPKESVF